MNQATERKTVCVDFDGVIAELTESIEDMGEPIPGAKEAMTALREKGCRIIIHTARPNAPEHRKHLEKHLRGAGIPFDEINTNSSCTWTADKPLADLYIDDRALRFEGNWERTLRQATILLGISPVENLTDEYSELLSLITERKDEIEAMERFLRAETSWLTSPASTRFHLASTGGLVRHSLNVAKTLLKLRDLLAPEISQESCVIAGLYHDLGKLGMPGKPYYLENPSEWSRRNRGIHYIVNPDIVHLDIATRSLYLVSRHISLTEDEIQAIRYHDGQYIDENRSVAHRETPLTRLLQYADNWSGGVLEEKHVDLAAYTHTAKHL